MDDLVGGFGNGKEMKTRRGAVAEIIEIKTCFQVEAIGSQCCARIEIKIQSVEVSSPAVAIEDGAATVFTKDAAPMSSRYTAVHDAARVPCWMS